MPCLIHAFVIVAKTHYLEKKDPNDCALYYVAMKKLSGLVRLFEIAEEKVVAGFLKNDFTNPKYVSPSDRPIVLFSLTFASSRYKTAALSNAYKLMSQHRFMLAATFFLIGDSLKNAVSVCIDKLDDFMLALFICRLYEGSQKGDVFRSVLETTILPRAKASKELELGQDSPIFHSLSFFSSSFS